MTAETNAEFVADMEWLHSHDREAALPPEKLNRLFALARRGAAMQWRPIQTAPKDGTPILLLVQFPGERPDTFVAAWDANSPKWPWRPTCDGSAYSEEYATHWMPLPPPPAGEQG